jgi:hypothetical protein
MYLMDEGAMKDFKEVLILLSIGSLLLLANSVFTVQVFSIQYGIGAGAAIQSTADGANVTKILGPTASEIQILYNMILESYVEVLLGLILFSIALVMWIRRSPRNESYKKTYIMSHAALALVYILLFFIMYSNIPSLFSGIFQYAAYFGMIIVLMSDAYLQYVLRRQQHQYASRAKRGIPIDPSTPYTNLLNIRDRVFDRLSGELRIVDKHINSAALSNLSRLLPSESGNIRSIKIVTSSEMLDSDFGVNYNDLRNELKNKGMSVEIWVMNPQDSGMQHERFLFDDKIAFKIPPLNIINRKSEHVVRMNIADARSRYKYLLHGSIKLENYQIKKAREDSATHGADKPAKPE